MKKIILIMFVVAGVFSWSTGVFAENTASISVTVTVPSQISVSVTPTSWAIGNVSLGEEKSTAENYFTATNGGNVAEDFSIVCGNSVNWTCGDTAGSEIFEMKAKGGDLSDWTSIHSSQTLKSNVAVGGTVSFGLKFKAPTLTSYTDTQQTITVTITASKH